MQRITSNKNQNQNNMYESNIQPKRGTGILSITEYDPYNEQKCGNKDNIHIEENCGKSNEYSLIKSIALEEKRNCYVITKRSRKHRKSHMFNNKYKRFIKSK